MSEEDKKERTPEEIAQDLTKARMENNNRRVAMMEEIADNSEKSRPEELEFQDESAAKEVAAETETKEAERYARSLQEEGVDKPANKDNIDSDTKQVNGDTYYRQIVNGVEKWQTLKEIRTSAAKVEAADEYLRTASESVKNASRLALSKQDEPSNLNEDEVADLLRRIALGDEDAIKALAPRLVRPSVNTADVLQQVDQRMSFRTELASLEGQSKDLLGDQYMGRLFRSRLNELKQESPNMGLSEAYTSIDKELRTAFPGFKTDKVQQKLERKRSLPTPITASARQGSEAEEEGEENASSVIEEMAKKRGYTPHVHTRRQ